MDERIEWAIFCRPDVFDKCRNREGFPELVCLARVINVLNYLYSPVSQLEGAEPHHIRDRMNFYLFNAAVLYEGLDLVRKMNKPFKSDATFRATLHSVLRDPTVQKIESLHLKKARHHAVNHFLPDMFSEVIKDLPTEECFFLKATGMVNKNIHFEFADRMAVRILVGPPGGGDFKGRLDNVLIEIQKFIGTFVTEATKFLVAKLYEWGFERKES
jgi:hypothetical protein